MLTDVENGEVCGKGNKGIKEYYKIESNLLMKKDFHHPNKWRIVVPASMVNVILKGHHNDRGHFGAVRTQAMIMENFCWEKMYSDIRQYVSNCIDCMRHKPDTHPVSRKLESITTTGPRELVSIDLIGKLPAEINLIMCVLATMFIRNIWWRILYEMQLL